MPHDPYLYGRCFVACSCKCARARGVWHGFQKFSERLANLWNAQSGTSETGQIRFRRVRFQTPSSVSFFLRSHRVPGRELGEFLSAYYFCVPKRTHRACRRTHRVTPKNSVSSVFRISTLETVCRHPLFPQCLWTLGASCNLEGFCRKSLVDRFLESVLQGPLEG